MLSARDLASLSDDLVELYAQLETDIKKNMLERLSIVNKVTDATVYQATILKQTGALKSDLKKLLSRFEPKMREELKTLFSEAMNKAKKQDLKYSQLGKRNLTESQQQRLETAVARLDYPEYVNKTFERYQEQFNQLYNDITRMTLTVAEHSEQVFLRACNKAYMQVSSGAFSWQKAYKTAVNEQAIQAYKIGMRDILNDGAKAVLYTQSGKARLYSIESATKMNVITGINQTASLQTIQNAGELNTNLVEVDAHLGARPFHAELQGKVYSLKSGGEYYTENGVSKFAPDFYTTCHYGQPDGICGINCRHSFYPYIPNSGTMYSKGELDEMNDSSVILNGKKVTQYEGEQALRSAERSVRNAKTEVMGYKIGGLENDPDYTKARQQLRDAQKRVREIVNETGLQRKYINEYIGTVDGVQPR